MVDIRSRVRGIDNSKKSTQYSSLLHAASEKSPASVGHATPPSAHSVHPDPTDPTDPEQIAPGAKRSPAAQNSSPEQSQPLLSQRDIPSNQIHYYPTVDPRFPWQKVQIPKFNGERSEFAAFWFLFEKLVTV